MLGHLSRISKDGTPLLPHLGENVWQERDAHSHGWVGCGRKGEIFSMVGIREKMNEFPDNSVWVA